VSSLRLAGWRLRLALAAGRGGARRTRGLELLVGLVVAGSLFCLAYFWTRAMLRYPETAGWAPVTVIGILHAAFLLSLLRDTAAALGHLFLSNDLPLLLAAPVRPRALVGLKGAEALADAASFPATVALPVLLAYGVAARAPLAYFAAAPLVLLLLLCLTVGAGFLIALLLAPVAPAGRVRQWLRIAVAAFSLVAWLALAWWNASPGGARWAAITEQTGGLLVAGPMAALPSGWAGAALVALVARADAATPLAKLAGLALVAMLAVGLASRAYPVAWQRSQETNRRAVRKRVPRRRVPAAAASGATTLPARARRGAGAGFALAADFARRDAKLIGRDPNLLWDMGLLLVMSSVLPIVAAPMLAERPQWVAIPALLFFAAELGYDLGSRAFPLERRALPWVLVAPLSPVGLLAARGAAAWTVGAALIAVAGTAAWVGLRMATPTAVAALASAWGLFSITLPAGFAAGLYLGRADWRHPRQMLNLGGRLLLVAILLLLSAGLALSLSVGSEPGALRLDIRSALAWSAAVGLVVVGVSLWAALRRLRTLEWRG